MDINLQIEQILLEDIDLSYGERLRLQAAVEAELSRLLTTHELPPHLQAGIAIPRISANLDLPEKPNPAHLGKQVAQSIYQNINGNQRQHQ
jgi:hypothetical protein